MKKVMSTLLIALICLSVTGCSNEFAKQEYDSDKIISKTEDRYAKEISESNTINGEYTLTISKFDGRETIWKNTLEQGQDIELGFCLSLSEGQVKIVHIDEENNVTTVIECSPETSTDGYETKTLSLKSGQNRLKIVGYDCKNIDLKMTISENIDGM
jgi:uncharacterized protein YxeA